MPFFQILIILFSFGFILIWLRLLQPPASDDKRASLPAIILTSWLISVAIFGAYFYVLRFAGFFDITIERFFFILILGLLLIGLFTGKVRFKKNIGIELAMALFLLTCVISMIRTGFLPSYPQFPSPWYVFITGYFFPFIIFIFAKNYIDSENDIQIILHALYFFGLYLCIIAAFEYFDMREFVFPRYINDSNLSNLHMERARGPFLNAAFNGFAIIVGLLSGIHLIDKKNGLTRFFYQSSLFLFFPAVFFTLTRSVYLGLLISIVIVLGWYKTTFSKWKLISLPLAFVLILAVVNSPRLLSTERREGGVYQVDEVTIRLALMKQSIIMFSERPFIGVGLAQFIPASIREYKGRVPYIAETAGSQYQHNHLLGLACELGIFGILFYVLIVVLILRRLLQLAQKLSENGLMGNNIRTVIFTVWCVYLCNNFFVEPSNNLFLNAVPFLFAGIADGLYTRSLETGQSLVSPIRTLQAYV